MKSPSIVKNYIYNTIYHIMTFFIPLITMPYLARVLQPDGTGTFSYTLSIQTYFSMFAALGTVTYGARVIARCRDDEQERSRNFWGIELLTILTSCAVLLVWAAFIIIFENYRIYFLILSLNILATTFDITWFFSGLEQFKFISLRNTFFKLLGAVLIFVFVRQKSDLSIYFLIYSGTALLSSLSMWPLLRKFLVKVSFRDLGIKAHFKETLIYFLPTVATSIYTVLDKTLIGLIVKDSSENGYYDQANQVVNIAKTITFGSINTVIGTRLSYLFAQGKIDELKQKMITAINFVFLLGYAIFFGIYVVAPDFVRLYFGVGYEKVEILLYCLSPVLIIISISSCLGTQYYIPSGKRLTSAKYLIYGSLVNLVLNLCTIPFLKSMGACISTLIAEVVISVLYVRGCEKYMTWKLIFLKSWKKILAGCVMFLLTRGVNCFIGDISAIIRLVIDIAVGAIIYFVVLFVLKDDAVKILVGIIKNMFNKKRA